jgi:hypothetical protein
VSLPSAFWDSSALIPLCVCEATSSANEALAKQFSQVVWWGTWVEVRSAIARLHRSGSLNTLDRGDALLALDTLAADWNETLPSDELRILAGDLLDRYSLRAADSLKLAAAMIWCWRMPAGRVFLCGDLRLAEAAEQAGFTVIRPGITTP